MSTSTLAADADPTTPPADQGPSRTVGDLARRAWTDAAFLVAGFATGTTFFVVAVTMLSLSAGLLVLVVGLPMLALTMELLRWCAQVERVRLSAVASRPVTASYAPLPSGWAARAFAVVRDPRRMLDAAYLVVQFPVAVAGFVVTVTSWAVAVYCLLYPALYWAIPEGDDGWIQIGTWSPDSFPETLLVFLLGVVAVPLAYGLSRGMTVVSVALGRAMLGDDRVRMEARVSRLEETRAGVVDASSAELRRIERDLHDGAQARMVAVAMDLGMAEERLDDDPEAARELLQGARDEARRALAEMRDLVRGVAPSVLADRGLDAALASLAGRCRIPVVLDVDLAERPPASAETAAYFVVAEALQNVAKHADARGATVVVLRHDDDLLVRVTDDGAGGAALAPEGGLAGLRDRVAALDGTLELTSPPGGPTTVAARIPCAS